MQRKMRSMKETWTMTDYELQRKPQNISDDAVESAVVPRSLHKELMCPICLEILKKTMTTKECLHRFCANCIITALRNGNKECPTCRKKLISKRSLRPDVNFDLLISKIYPNLDKYEAEHERVIARLNTSYMQMLAENNILQQENQDHSEEVFDQSSKNSNNEKKKRTGKRQKYFSISEHLLNFIQDNNCESSSNLSTDNDNDVKNDSIIPDEIEIILKPHPSVEAIKNNKPRFLKTPTNSTVDHLKQYLTMRQKLECHSNSLDNLNNDICDMMNNVHIYIAESPNRFIALNGPETSQQLKEKFCKLEEPLDLYYSSIELKFN